jgi:hypothetical protein
VRITVDGAGVVLAFALAGVAAGSWSAFVTFQLAKLRREVCKIRATVDQLARVLPV